MTGACTVHRSGPPTKAPIYVAYIAHHREEVVGGVVPGGKVDAGLAVQGAPADQHNLAGSCVGSKDVAEVVTQGGNSRRSRPSNHWIRRRWSEWQKPEAGEDADAARGGDGQSRKGDLGVTGAGSGSARACKTEGVGRSQEEEPPRLVVGIKGMSREENDFKNTSIGLERATSL